MPERKNALSDKACCDVLLIIERVINQSVKRTFIAYYENTLITLTYSKKLNGISRLKSSQYWTIFFIHQRLHSLCNKRDKKKNWSKSKILTTEIKNFNDQS